MEQKSELTSLIIAGLVTYVVCIYEHTQLHNSAKTHLYFCMHVYMVYTHYYIHTMYVLTNIPNIRMYIYIHTKYIHITEGGFVCSTCVVIQLVNVW